MCFLEIFGEIRNFPAALNQTCLSSAITITQLREVSLQGRRLVCLHYPFSLPKAVRVNIKVLNLNEFICQMAM